MLWLDHVILGVRDLSVGAQLLEDAFGIATRAGGVHPGGTANRAAFFADGSYLELLAVEDREKSGGAWLSREIADGDKLIGWAVRTDSIDDVAHRTGHSVEVGSIELADGTRGTWRTVTGGLDRWSGALPFFIQYDSARNTERLRAAPQGGIRWVEVCVDEHELAGWLGECPLDIRCVGQGEGLVAVGIELDGREVVLQSDRLLQNDWRGKSPP